MKNFNQYSKSGPRQNSNDGGYSENRGYGGGGRGGQSSFGGGPRAAAVMHQATCDGCGASCEVPFKPRGDKDVFCSNCFKKDGFAPRRDQDDRKPFRPTERSDSGPRNADLTHQLEIMSSKLDKILKIVSAMSQDVQE